MSNVMLLNYFYDVPVKILSTLLVVMTLWLLLPMARALFAFFVDGRSARLELPPPLTSLPPRVGMLPSAAFVVILVMGQAGIFAWGEAQAAPANRFFVVDSFAPADAQAWRAVELTPRAALFVLVDGSLSRYSYEEKTDELSLRPRNGGEPLSLRSSHDGDTWTLSGAFEGREVQATVVLAEPPKFFLMERGFHWVNEFPLNR